MIADALSGLAFSAAVFVFVIVGGFALAAVFDRGPRGLSVREVIAEWRRNRP